MGTGLQSREKGDSALAAPFEMEKTEISWVGSGGRGPAAARRLSKADVGRRRRQMQDPSLSFTANRLLFLPSSSLLLKLRASKQAREWIVVIPPCSGQIREAPMLRSRGTRAGALGRGQLAGKFCSCC